MINTARVQRVTAMTAVKWAYEDFAEGMVIELGKRDVSAEEIIEFASEFDPQPFHLDEEAGKASILGGLSASGWHTCGIFMRMLCDGLLLDSTSQGGPGVDMVKWKRPVLAGDTLTGRGTVRSKRVSQKRPHIGLVFWHFDLFNQRGEIVFEFENTVMFSRREAA
jgi:acyl dehydratase